MFAIAIDGEWIKLFNLPFKFENNEIKKYDKKSRDIVKN